MTIAACLVTRGDVSLNPILQKLDAFGMDEVVIWNNAERDDVAVYGRYAAITETTAELIYVQDDDCTLEADAIQQLVSLHEPGHVVCNMPPQFRHPFYRDHALVGFGAVFERALPQLAFNRLIATNQVIDWGAFNRACDIVFAALTPRILADIPKTDLPHAHAPNRMWKQPDHLMERTHMLELALAVRDEVPA